jgi:hypothetical protein
MYWDDKYGTLSVSTDVSCVPNFYADKETSLEVSIPCKSSMETFIHYSSAVFEKNYWTQSLFSGFILNWFWPKCSFYTVACCVYNSIGLKFNPVM